MALARGLSSSNGERKEEDRSFMLLLMFIQSDTSIVLIDNAAQPCPKWD